MPTYEVSETVVYRIEAESEDEAEGIAVEYPEREPTYKLVELEREVYEI